MALPLQFLRSENFELAFTRVVRGSNKSYKNYYRHLFPAFNLALKENLKDLIDDLRRGTFEPAIPTVVFEPKQSGVLRPLTLLSLRDLIVYQAIVNRVASLFEGEQQQYAFKKTFGAILAGASSEFFYRSWRVSYGKYCRAITLAFEQGNDFVADFDLVSFYELIEHGLLAERLRKHVDDQPLVDLLLKCLRRWTSDKAGAHLGHGVPQGPEPSAFLAECFLFHFDSRDYRQVRYFRYIDDIRLMSKDEVPIRRALLRLDLQSKELGLVPQAQKIQCRRVTSLDDVLKIVPSGVGDHHGGPASGLPRTQAELLRLFRQSLKKASNQWTVDDSTKFKFALNRINPRRDVLRRIAPLLSHRPDLSWALSNYLRRFGPDVEVANILLTNLRRDPTYDAAASNYIDALDLCEPPVSTAKYRRVIFRASARSEENSILLRIASLSFRGRRKSIRGALALIESESDPRVQGIALNRLFGLNNAAPFKRSSCIPFLEKCTESQDPDLARYCAALLIEDWPWNLPITWNTSKASNRSVLLLFQALGLRKRAPAKRGVLDVFFKVKMNIGMAFPWIKALGKDRREVERRCLKYQELAIGDPTVRITFLDTFNELLVQTFSARHPALRPAYSKATPKNAKHPDFGNWVRNPALTKLVPRASKWFLEIHEARVKGELAHAKAKGTGKPTGPISFERAAKLVRPAQIAWAELIKEWRKVV